MTVAMSSTSESESAAIVYLDCHLRVQRVHKSLLDRMPVAQRKDTRHVFLFEASIDEDRSLAGMQQLAHARGVIHPRNRTRMLEAAGQRHGHKIDAGSRVTRLHAGLTVMGVVEHDDGEIAGLLDADGREAADAHQHVTISGEDRDPAARLRQRQAEANHRGAPHSAPEIEVERIVSGRSHVVSRRAETADNQKVSPINQQPLHKVAPVEHLCSYRVHCLRPISRWASRIATWRLPSNAVSQPAPTISSTSSGFSTR